MADKQINEPKIAPVTRKTVSSPFFQANYAGQTLFAVAEGVPVDDALEWASCFLASVIDTLASLADEHTHQPQFYTAVYLAQMAKAAVNASSSAIVKEVRP